MFYICTTIYKANHNKDYSVVKTFKAGQLAFLLNTSFVVEYLQWNPSELSEML